MVDGIDFATTLSKLALIHALAWSLKHDLDPLSPEDASAGAEPLSAEQIQAELDRICELISQVALQDLKATGDEWLEATDSIA